MSAHAPHRCHRHEASHRCNAWCCESRLLHIHTVGVGDNAALNQMSLRPDPVMLPRINPFVMMHVACRTQVPWYNRGAIIAVTLLHAMS